MLETVYYAEAYPYSVKDLMDKLSIVEFIFDRTNAKSTHYILQTFISLEE